MPKYHNKKTVGFDSKKESARYQELLLLQRAGRISGLQTQVTFELLPNQYIDGKCVERAVKYVADFTYSENGNFVVEDVKGFRTKDYRIKRKLLLWRYGIRIRET